jgi:hypothetical protein
VAQEDEYQLENLAREHAIGASLFMPFVIQRLQVGDQTEAVLSVSLRDIGRGDQGERGFGGETETVSSPLFTSSTANPVTLWRTAAAATSRTRDKRGNVVLWS